MVDVKGNVEWGIFLTDVYMKARSYGHTRPQAFYHDIREMYNDEKTIDEVMEELF